MLRLSTAIALCVTALLSPAARASEFGYLSQQRELACWVSVFECFEDSSDEAAAPDFEPFDASITAMVDCTTDAGTAHAEQTSILGPSSVLASGSASSATLMSEFNFLIADASTDVVVDIELSEPTRVAVSGFLTAVATADVDQESFWVFSRLELQAGEDVEIEHEVIATVNQPPAMETVDEVRILQAGVYTLLVRAFSSYADAVEVTGNSMSTFMIEVNAFDLADIDLDGTVGFGDLLALLGQWGHCPVRDVCAADLTKDGVVAFDDLVLLLARWTA